MNYSRVILITDLFPYQSTEVGFLREEIKHLAEKYDVTIVTKDPSPKTNPTQLPDNVTLLNYNPAKGYNPLCLLLRCLTFSCLYSELIRVKINRYIFSNIAEVIKKLMRSIHLSDYLKEIRSGIDGNVCFYTYWNDYSTHACLLTARREDRVISRCHGHDLYKFNPNLCPYKDYINPRIDLLAPISNIGERYYRDNYNNDVNIRTYHLGVPPAQRPAIFNNSNSIRIFSLARLHPIKRIPLLIETLAKISPSINIEWTHIGGTPQQLSLAKAMAKSELEAHQNIHYTFKGELPNNEVMEFLTSTPFDFIINTSSSEGIPVSIMEAMSLGIPAIGTNVGGNPEIIIDKKNGYLMPVDFQPTHLEKIFTQYLSLSYEEKMELRNNAFTTWANEFNADVNFSEFVANAII